MPATECRLQIRFEEGGAWIDEDAVLQKQNGATCCQDESRWAGHVRLESQVWSTAGMHLGDRRILVQSTSWSARFHDARSRTHVVIDEERTKRPPESAL